MRRVAHIFTATILMALILPIPPNTGPRAHAADLGTHGRVWPITETSLLERIAVELGKAEADGRLAAFNGRVRGQIDATFTSPPALPLARAARPASRLFDPSITARRDIRDHKGTLIVARGTRVNPLERMPLAAALIFIDGRDEAQLAFALTRPGPKTIILTGGGPKALMETHGHRMYFDQKGVLTRRFGLTALPSVITQDGPRLRIDEVVVTDAPTGTEPGTGRTSP